MARIIILSARNWSFRDEKTGEPMSGVTLEGTEAQSNEEADYRGMGAVKYKASPEAWESLKGAPLPGVFEVEVGLRRGKGGTAQASIERAVLVHSIDLATTKRAAAA